MKFSFNDRRRTGCREMMRLKQEVAAIMSAGGLYLIVE